MQSQSIIVTNTQLAYILGTTFTTLQLTMTSYGFDYCKKVNNKQNNNYHKVVIIRVLYTLIVVLKKII